MQHFKTVALVSSPTSLLRMLVTPLSSLIFSMVLVYRKGTDEPVKLRRNHGKVVHSVKWKGGYGGNEGPRSGVPPNVALV